MAIVTIPAADRRITGFDDVKTFLAGFHIDHEIWPLEDRVDPGAPAEAILAAYAPEIEDLKAKGGFVTADVIDVRPETPNLDTMLAKFSKEHTHSEDEVRFILQGRGVFHIHATGPDGTDTVFAIEVGAGDLISVPIDTRHWFDLCDDRRIARLHDEWMGDPTPTDVITFDLSDPAGMPGGDGVLRGDLVVSTETAVRMAKEVGSTPRLETAYYVIHGILHLTGHDDLSPGPRRAMRRRERTLMGALGLPTPPRPAGGSKPRGGRGGR
jgi:1,2-dihydroxy-3-keto-5-methylthiopentene dioxygenase